MINKIKNIIEKQLFIIKVRSVLKQNLSPGVYRFEVSSITKRKPDFSLRTLKVKGNKKINNDVSTYLENKEKVISIYSGSINKILAITNDKVFSFYKNSSKYVLINIIKYKDFITYPKVEFYNISVDNCYTITKRIIGEKHDDLDHRLKLAQEMLSYAINSIDEDKPKRYSFIDEDKYKNIRYYIQHGDFGSGNVLWQKNNYCVIDFDTIGVYPTFYDFLSCILASKRSFLFYLGSTFDDQIIQYERKHNINETVESFKDECLAMYTLLTYEMLSTDLKIRKYVPKEYTKTRDVLFEIEISRNKK